MLKKFKTTLIITSLLILLPALIGVLLWNRLPDVMATHFGFDNEANGFSSKVLAVFGIPLFCLALQWIGALVTSHDPKKQNINPKLFALVLWIIPFVSLIGAATIYPYNLGYRADITFAAKLIMGALFTVVGNYMPKMRQTYTMGIRIPWTLANEENWNRTHRLAGYLWLAGGVLTVALTLCDALPLGLMLALLALCILVPIGYSFWLHVSKSL